jgi:hypothetical protein
MQHIAACYRLRMPGFFTSGLASGPSLLVDTTFAVSIGSQHGLIADAIVIVSFLLA